MFDLLAAENIKLKAIIRDIFVVLDEMERSGEEVPIEIAIDDESLLKQWRAVKKRAVEVLVSS